MDMERNLIKTIKKVALKANKEQIDNPKKSNIEVNPILDSRNL